ncbi:hypothetical protein J1N35_008617 [Gossypium stocksii]|uniref:Endonuclease/exonuclease/phosphatase domain-containing protein n=1 Tax=Gossypium stocksii TaxID=47602 RepID=A0A9D3W842_9ROSI|nr:hypothetical protein J1N35_008617 [Gossypium stocksii]
MLFLTETAEKILVCCVLLKLKLILVLSGTYQIIHCRVLDGSTVLMVSFAYGQPSVIIEDQFWMELQNFATQNTLQRIIMGDFNDFASLDEREGGVGNGVERMIQFKERWSMCNLMGRVLLN